MLKVLRQVMIECLLATIQLFLESAVQLCAELGMEFLDPGTPDDQRAPANHILTEHWRDVLGLFNLSYKLLIYQLHH